MKYTYQEIMERVEVTPQMQERVMENIRQADLTERKIVPFSKYRRFAATAAALLMLIAVGAVLPNVIGRQSKTPDQEEIQVIWQSREWASAQELSGYLGFEIVDLAGLPFEPDTVTYLSIGEDLAEITYSAGTNEACYRISPGTEDNSGNYTDFPVCETVKVGAYEVLLKGRDGGFELALWSDGVYTYSLDMAEQQSIDVWIKLLKENLFHLQEN